MNPISQNQDGYFDYKSTSSTAVETKPRSPTENGISTNRMTTSGNRSSKRFSSAKKQLMNEKIAAMRRSTDDRLSSNQLPDLVLQKYNDSGHQRPAPQVPIVTNKINSCQEVNIKVSS